MGTQLLDSGIIVLALRGNARALAVVPPDPEDPPCISVVTRTEILAGMRPREEARTLDLLDTLSSLGVSPTISDRAGRPEFRVHALRQASTSCLRASLISSAMWAASAATPAALGTVGTRPLDVA